MKRKRCHTRDTLIDDLIHIRQGVAQAETAETLGVQPNDSVNASDEVFRSVFDSLPDQVYVLDHEWRVVAANRAAYKFVAIPEERMRGKRLVELWPGIGGTVAMQAMQTVMETGRPSHITDELTTPDGGKAWFEAYLCPVPQGIILTTTDITKHKQKERALEDEATLFRTTLDHIADAVVVCTANRQVAFANQAARQLWHRDLVGNVLGVARQMCAEAYDDKGETMPPTEWPILGALRGNTTDRESHVIWPDGCSVDLHTTAIPVRANSGAIIAAVSTVRDITERKRFQKTLEGLCAEKERLYREAEEQARKISGFIKTLVHELRTPLTPMLGASEMLLDRLESGELRRMAENINRGVQSLDRRVGDLADLAKGEVGLLHIRYKMFDIKETLHEIIEYVMPEAEKKQQVLCLKVAGCLPTLYGDENRVRQVIFNLLANALKFTPSGGKITLRAHARNTDLVVEVVDNGPGIAEEAQKRLFEPCRLWEKGDGDSPLGVGLPLCRMLVELHGGRIWVRSEKEKGSTFGFSIPFDGGGRPLRKSSEVRV